MKIQRTRFLKGDEKWQWRHVRISISIYSISLIILKMCILFLASGKFHFIRDCFERLCLSLVERTTVKIHPRPFKILSIRVDERGGVNKWIKFGNKRETWLTLTCSDTCSRISRFLRLLLFHGVLIVDEFYHFWCGLSRRDRTSRRMELGDCIGI